MCVDGVKVFEWFFNLGGTAGIKLSSLCDEGFFYYFCIGGKRDEGNFKGWFGKGICIGSIHI